MSASFAVPGKYILTGEHAVVYGAMAVAYPVARAMNVECDKVFGDVRITGLDRDFLRGKVFGGALDRLRSLVDFSGFSARISSRLPHGAGLGGSASLSCALVRCALHAAGIPWNPGKHRILVHELEKVFHGSPSGIDDAVVSFGIPVVLNPSGVVQGMLSGLDESGRIGFLDLPRPTVLLVDSGQRSDTRMMVRQARNTLATLGITTEELVSQANELTLRALHAIRSGDFSGLGVVFDGYHELLASLGLSTPRVEEIRHTAHGAGAEGSKITGAGGGGFVLVAVEPERIRATAASLSDRGYRVFIP